jgi:hypothetical protein
MIRTVITPDSPSISIQLPTEFIGKRVEVIAFTFEEATVVKEPDATYTHFASERSLAKDWLTDEEDKAWQDL